MASKIPPQAVLKALTAVVDPSLQRDIASLGLVKDIEVGDSRVSLTLQLPNPSSPASEQIIQNAKSKLRALGVGEDDLDRKSTRLNSSHSQISYAVFCLKKKKK